MAEISNKHMDTVMEKAEDLVRENDEQLYEEVTDRIASMMSDVMIERDLIVTKRNKVVEKYERCRNALDGMNQLQQDESLSTSQQEAVDAMAAKMPVKTISCAMDGYQEELKRLDTLLEKNGEKLEALKSMDVEEEVDRLRALRVDANDESNHQVGKPLPVILDYTSLIHGDGDEDKGYVDGQYLRAIFNHLDLEDGEDKNR